MQTSRLKLELTDWKIRMRCWAHLQCIPVFLPTFLWFDFLVALRANHDLHGLWAVVLDVVLIGVLDFYHTTHCALHTHLLPHRILQTRLFFSTTIQLYLYIENCWKCIQESLISVFNSPVRPFLIAIGNYAKNDIIYIFFSTLAVIWEIHSPLLNLLTLTYYNDQIGCWLRLHWIYYEHLAIVKLISKVSTTKTSACKLVRAII